MFYQKCSSDLESRKVPSIVSLSYRLLLIKLLRKKRKKCTVPSWISKRRSIKCIEMEFGTNFCNRVHHLNLLICSKLYTKKLNHVLKSMEIYHVISRATWA